MKYAAFRGARVFQLELLPEYESDAMRGERSRFNVAAQPRHGVGGLKRNKMEKREIRPRKFNGRRGRDMRRDEDATWRQSHGSGSHKCSAEVRGLQSDHLTVPPDGDDKCPRYVENKTRKFVFRRNMIRRLSLEMFK